MKKYSCKCPAPGCDFVIVEKASNWEKAFNKMYISGGRHIVDNHPDFPDLEDPEGRAREFALKYLKQV